MIVTRKSKKSSRTQPLFISLSQNKDSLNQQQREQNNADNSSSSEWGDTPTPSIDKSFDWNIYLEKQNQNLLEQLISAQKTVAKLDEEKISLVEEIIILKKKCQKLKDQAQQEKLERKGEVNLYHQKLKEFQDNEEELWKVIDNLQYWQKHLQDNLNHSCQELLKSEKEFNHFSQLVARYKKGKTSWEQQANLLDFELQEAHQELVQQEELLDLKNTTIANLAEQLKKLKKEVGQQNQANSKKKKQLQRTGLRISIDQQKITNQANLINQLQQDKQNLQTQINNHTCSCPQICCVNGDYTQIKQERDNYQRALNSHVCPSVDNQELTGLRKEIQAKDQKIKDLEQEIKELKDKPPVMVANSEEEKLLAIVQEKEQIIKQLETQLSQTQPQAIIKEVESGTIIQELKGKLSHQEQKIKQLHVVYLLLLGISALISVGLVSKKKTKN